MQPFEDNGGDQNQFDKTLEELGIFNHFIFRIETKTDEGEFEYVNPNWVYLKLLSYSGVESYLKGDAIQQDAEEGEFAIDF